MADIPSLLPGEQMSMSQNLTLQSALIFCLLAIRAEKLQTEWTWSKKDIFQPSWSGLKHTDGLCGEASIAAVYAVTFSKDKLRITICCGIPSTKFTLAKKNKGKN